VPEWRSWERLESPCATAPRNVTGLVDALEAAGLVARNRHPTDRRANVVNVTPHGKRTASAWQAEYRKLASLLFDDLAAADRAHLATALEPVLEMLRTSTPAPPDRPGAKRRQPKGQPAST
jgi:hypothetical protein